MEVNVFQKYWHDCLTSKTAEQNNLLVISFNNQIVFHHHLPITFKIMSKFYLILLVCYYANIAEPRCNLVLKSQFNKYGFSAIRLQVFNTEF